MIFLTTFENMQYSPPPYLKAMTLGEHEVVFTTNPISCFFTQHWDSLHLYFFSFLVGQVIQPYVELHKVFVALTLG
jgi:hypothetical protein